MVANKWAESRSNWLLRRDEGVTGLEREMRWTVQDSIRNDSFLFPLSTRYSHGVALIQTGHTDEAREVLGLAQALAVAALEHDQDHGGAMSAVLKATFLTHLYCCRWLLEQKRDVLYLSQAVNELAVAERRADSAGHELGDEGYEELALLHVLLKNGGQALKSIERLTDEPPSLDPVAIMHGTLTRKKTLALAAHPLANTTPMPAEGMGDRLRAGVQQVMREQFQKPSPHARTLLLWLDLPNVLFGRQGDPWAMLAQVNEMVGE